MISGREERFAPEQKLGLDFTSPPVRPELQSAGGKAL